MSRNVEITKDPLTGLYNVNTDATLTTTIEVANYSTSDVIPNGITVIIKEYDETSGEYVLNEYHSDGVKTLEEVIGHAPGIAFNGNFLVDSNKLLVVEIDS